MTTQPELFDTARRMHTEPRRLCNFSPDRKYRYTLSLTRLGDMGGVVNFIMLNPSTADELANDPTVERCQQRAFVHGLNGRYFRELVVTNLFAYRATDPVDMKACATPIGDENVRWIMYEARRADLVVCGWGEHGKHLGQGLRIARALQAVGITLHALKVNASGEPAHPLYLPYELQPQVWRPAA